MWTRTIPTPYHSRRGSSWTGAQAGGSLGWLAPPPPAAATVFLLAVDVESSTASAPTLQRPPASVPPDCSGEPAYPALEDWIEIFRHSIGSFRRTAEADPSLPEPERQRRAAQFADAYLALVNETERQALAACSEGSTNGDAAAAAAVGCLELCRLR